MLLRKQTIRGFYLVMSIFTRPLLEINLNNLKDNFLYLKSLAKDSIAAAVIKDDAYGLGALEVASTLYEKAGCRHFFVAHAVEGEKIYPFVKDATIYVLQGIGDDNLEIFQKLKLIPVINGPEQFAFWKENKISGIKPAIHIDTGLNRLGFRRKDLEKLSSVELEDFSLVISHLACADVNNHFMNQLQLDEFYNLKQKYFPNIPASLAASDGVFLGEKFTCDMVRLGAAVYGINTAPYRQSSIKNVIKISAPILQITDLEAGAYVGYSATYKAACNRKIAIVSIGYGDGLPRSLSNVGKAFWQNGEKVEQANIIGRVSMDNIICDITNIEGLKTGDMLQIINDNYTVDDMGSDVQTIGYEILSRFGKNRRFARIYNK